MRYSMLIVAAVALSAVITGSSAIAQNYQRPTPVYPPPGQGLMTQTLGIQRLGRQQLDGAAMHDNTDYGYGDTAERMARARGSMGNSRAMIGGGQRGGYGVLEYRNRYHGGMPPEYIPGGLNSGYTVVGPYIDRGLRDCKRHFKDGRVIEIPCNQAILQ